MFIRKLCQNTKEILKPMSQLKYELSFDRMYIILNGEDPKAVAEKLKTVFGIHSFSFCYKVESDLEKIKDIRGKDVSGYEIHNGISKIGKNTIPFIKDADENILGVCDESGLVSGTYLHWIFDSEEFLKAFISSLRENSNIHSDDYEACDNIIIDKKDKEYDRLAQVFKDNIDINKLRKIIGI